jgi:hypothetical protein
MTSDNDTQLTDLTTEEAEMLEVIDNSEQVGTSYATLQTSMGADGETMQSIGREELSSEEEGSVTPPPDVTSQGSGRT